MTFDCLCRPVAFLTAFDAPPGELNCERRLSSTAAPQALMLMNSDFVLQQAGHFARRLRTEAAAAAPPQQVAAAWRSAYQRPPSADEADRAGRFLARQAEQLRAHHADPDLAALTNLCQQLLASNEFLYVD